MKKQIKLSQLPRFINKLAKEGNTITRCVKNGNNNKGIDDSPYVLVEWRPNFSLNRIKLKDNIKQPLGVSHPWE